MRQQAGRHHTARAHRQALVPAETHFAVAAEPDRVDPHRLDHRLPVADIGAVVGQLRLTVADDRDIGGGAAHVGDDGVVEAGQLAGADDARRRARQHRADRFFDRVLEAGQRTVALDQHQRRVDSMAREDFLHRADQLLDRRHHARVQRRGQRAPRRAEAGGQLVPANHRHAGEFGHHVFEPDFVAGVARAEHARYRKRRYLVLELFDGFVRGGLVQR